MSENPKIDFKHFLKNFPEIELPITLGEESHHAFSQNNDPLPAAMIDQFLVPLEEDPVDELTEFIACFSFPSTKKFHAIVYWKASLLNYQYKLVTFDLQGKLIAQKVIAGTFAHDDVITQSVATIKDDWAIYIVTGQAMANTMVAADPTTSKAKLWAIGTEGKIVMI
ncbi:MAG: hypothetical protein DHS20C18_20770 [Saprospiraceae bacterium]|nr:MAG: hypothetical protein DHS20C18_20770 [Saprospiraceae bacterium]